LSTPRATSTTDPLPERAQRILTAWSHVRYAILGVLGVQIVEAIDLVVEPIDLTGFGPGARLGVVLFTLGWLALVAIVAGGVWQRRRWALWIAGIYAGLAIPIYVSGPFIKVEQGETLIRSSSISTGIDLLAAVACAAFLFTLVRLRQARRSGGQP
jgi:hypothetical protein